MLYKFSSNDVLHNRIEAHPNINFKIYDGQVYYNNITADSGTFAVGHVDLYENNINRPAGQRIYPFITKASSLMSFKTISTTAFNTDFSYGDTISGSYPLAASISIERYVDGVARPRINALKATFERYKISSNHYSYNSDSASLGDKSSQEIKLINIPSIFYGSSIRKGSVSCKFYVTGTLAAELTDDRGRGELRQKLPEDANSGSVAGVVLYKEGFVALTGSWSIHPSHAERYDIYDPGTAKSPRWLDFATTGSTTPADLTNVASSSFELDFEGTTYIPTLTMFLHLPKGQLNYSSNPTFISYNQTSSYYTSSMEYRENDQLTIKNIVRSPFIEPTASFKNIVYITQAGIYDKNKNLIATIKLANPLRKRENDDFTIKCKLDV